MKKVSDKQRAKNEERKGQRAIMFSVFMDVWHKRKHYSEVSGRWLGKEALSIYFHHILPKSNYPEAMLDEDNIILLTFDEHQKVESDPEYYEEINKRRTKLKEKYDRST